MDADGRVFLCKIIAFSKINERLDSRVHHQQKVELEIHGRYFTFLPLSFKDLFQLTVNSMRIAHVFFLLTLRMYFFNLLKERTKSKQHCVKSVRIAPHLV